MLVVLVCRGHAVSRAAGRHAHAACTRASSLSCCVGRAQNRGLPQAAAMLPVCSVSAKQTHMQTPSATRDSAASSTHPPPKLRNPALTAAISEMAAPSRSKNSSSRAGRETERGPCTLGTYSPSDFLCAFRVHNSCAGATRQEGQNDYAYTYTLADDSEGPNIRPTPPTSATRVGGFADGSP